MVQDAFCQLDALVASMGESARPSVCVGALAPLRDALSAQLQLLVRRVLILEINIARLEGTLQGDTPQERYETFCRSLKTTTRRAEIFALYPVLARLCVDVCKRWITASSEFLLRLHRDHQRLQQIFGMDDLGTLNHAEVADSDSHDGGRSVIIAVFDGDRRVVYKPRPMAVAKQMQQFIEWANRKGVRPELDTLKVIDCGEYGWIEYVRPTPCESPEQFEDYFRRQGSLLAIMHCLGGSDCHFENIVACGARPVLVDVETLFQPRVPFETVGAQADVLAVRSLRDSVLGVGLLPMPVRLGERLVDLSGLAADPNQLTHLETLEADQDGTDEMTIQRVPYRLGDVHSRARCGSSLADVRDHADALDRGFGETYDLLRSHQRELLDENGPISAFNDVPIRVLFRPTSIYSQLLREASHPTALQNGLERERVLSQLWAGTSMHPVLGKVVRSEYAQALNGDIPYFLSTPTSMNVVGANGECVSNVFAATGRACAEERIRQLGTADLLKQRWIMRAAIASLQGNSRLSMSASDESAGDAGFIGLATRIGEFIDKTAIKSGDGASWLSLNMGEAASGHTDYAIGLVDSELYDGLAGIALFLGYLGAATGERRFKTLARQAIHTLDRRTEIEPITAVGAFSGLGGRIYVYSHLAALWEDRELVERATDQVERVHSLLPADTQLDIVDGAAGAIMGLLSLDAIAPASRALACAEACARHIVEALAKDVDGGVSPLRYRCGASHGYSGVGWALLELGSVTSQYSLIDFGRLLFAREDELVSSDGWTDSHEPQLLGQMTWCHGAPGMALCRLAAYRAVGDASLLRGARIALEATRVAKQSRSHTLCHGDLGVLETLITAAEIMGNDQACATAASSQAMAILRDIEKHGWISARPGGIEVPGLMTGIAGIGLQLLRIAEPKNAPKVLLLSRPVN